MSPQIKIDPIVVARFCKHWGVAELSLFGSALRQDFSPESDIDVLISFMPESHPTLFDMVRMRAELSQFFDRPVDLVSRRGIENSRNHLRRKEILDSAYRIYAAAA